MGKDSTKVKGARSQRHDPLHVQLADMPETTTMKKAPRQKFIDRNNRAEENGEEYLDAKLSKKILKIAREQQEQIEKAEEDEEERYIKKRRL